MTQQTIYGAATLDLGGNGIPVVVFAEYPWPTDLTGTSLWMAVGQEGVWQVLDISRDVLGALPDLLDPDHVTVVAASNGPVFTGKITTPNFIITVTDADPSLYGWDGVTTPFHYAVPATIEFDGSANLLWTEAGDVTARWIGDDPHPADTAKIETLLADAEDTVLREFPDLPTRVYDDQPAEGVVNPIPKSRVQKVVARIVIRHLRNPSGHRTRMEVTGPFTEQVAFTGNDPGSLYLTDEDRAELGGALSGAAFTIDQTPTVVPSGPHFWLEHGRTWV